MVQQKPQAKLRELLPTNTSLTYNMLKYCTPKTKKNSM